MLHLLLVEDNPGDVLLLREALRASSIDADVVIAYDGEQAERFLEELGDIALVVLDLNLPKVNGFEILEHYRAKHGQPLPSVIVLTGSENPADEKRARALGVSDYIVKPTGYYAFVIVVKAMVERWAAKTDSTAATSSDTSHLTRSGLSTLAAVPDKSQHQKAEIVTDNDA